MSYRDAQAELDELLEQIFGNAEMSPAILVDDAMMQALAVCQVKRSRRPHAVKLMTVFLEKLTGVKMPDQRAENSAGGGHGG